MKETIALTQREQARGQVLNLLLEGHCTATRAAELMDLSVRQVRRLKQRYREDGPGALAHGNRGRPPANAVSLACAATVVRLASSEYAGFNHSHICELLEEEHGIKLSRPTVARLLRNAGIRSPRRRRVRRYHARRARSAREGMLIQVDASQHDWLEGRGPRLVLVGGVDDATSAIVWGRFREREDAAGYLLMLRESVREHGIPLAWYADKHGAFQRNDKEPWTIGEQLAGGRVPTQVGQALAKLGITLIPAHTPQAKGRVERCWETLQDRLVKDLRRADARTIEEANVVLERFLPRYRQRFGRPPADPASAYRPLKRGDDLDAICSFHYVRVVGNDNVVRLEERTVQLPPGPRGRSYARCRVDVQERLDGRFVISYQGKVVAEQDPPEGHAVRPRHRQRGLELPRDPKPTLGVVVEADVTLPADLFVPLTTEHPWRLAPLLQRRRATP
jgi:transposase